MFNKVKGVFSKKSRGSNEAGHGVVPGKQANGSAVAPLQASASVPPRGLRPGRRRSCSDAQPQANVSGVAVLPLPLGPEVKAAAELRAQQQWLPTQGSKGPQPRMTSSTPGSIAGPRKSASDTGVHAPRTGKGVARKAEGSRGLFNFARRRSSELTASEAPQQRAELGCFAAQESMKAESSRQKAGGFVGFVWRHSLDYQRQGASRRSFPALGESRQSLLHGSNLESFRNGNTMSPATSTGQATAPAQLATPARTAHHPVFEEEVAEESSEDEEMFTTDDSGNVRRWVAASLSPSSLPSSRTSGAARSSSGARSMELAAGRSDAAADSGANVSLGLGGSSVAAPQVQSRGPWDLRHPHGTSAGLAFGSTGKAMGSSSTPRARHHVAPAAAGRAAGPESPAGKPTSLFQGPPSARAAGPLPSPPQVGLSPEERPMAGQKKFPDFAPPSRAGAGSALDTAPAAQAGSGDVAGKRVEVGAVKGGQHTEAAHGHSGKQIPSGPSPLVIIHHHRVDSSWSSVSPGPAAGSRRGSGDMSPWSSRSSSWRRSLEIYGPNHLLGGHGAPSELSAHRRSLDAVYLRGCAPPHPFLASPESPLEAYNTTQKRDNPPGARPDRAALISPGGEPHRRSLDFSFIPRSGAEALRRQEQRAAYKASEPPALERLLPKVQEGSSGLAPRLGRRSLDVTPGEVLMISAPVLVASSKSPVLVNLAKDLKGRTDGSASFVPRASSARSPFTGTRRLSLDYSNSSQWQGPLNAGTSVRGRLSADHADERAGGAPPLLVTPEDQKRRKVGHDRSPTNEVDAVAAALLRRNSSAPSGFLTPGASASWLLSPSNTWPAAVEPSQAEEASAAPQEARRAARSDSDEDACVFLTREISDLRDHIWELQQTRADGNAPQDTLTNDAGRGARRDQRLVEQLEGEVSWLRSEVAALCGFLTQLEVGAFLHERAVAGWAAEAGGGSSRATTPRRSMSFRKGDSSPGGSSAAARARADLLAAALNDSRRGALLAALLQDVKGERYCVEQILMLHREGNAEIKARLMEDLARL